jgi:hypothetical protein
MVVVDLLEDIIAEERKLEEELRRLSLSSIKPLTIIEDEQQSRNETSIPSKPTHTTTLDRTRAALERLRVINSLQDSYTSIRKEVLGKFIAE